MAKIVFSRLIAAVDNNILQFIRAFIPPINVCFCQLQQWSSFVLRRCMKIELHMKNHFYFILSIIVCLISCKKESSKPDTPNSPTPKMEYFDFLNKEIKAGLPGLSIDFNRDGQKDIIFSTRLVGDALNQVDKLQFLVQSNIKVNLAVKSSEEMPILKMGDSIFLSNFQDYFWYELSSIVLVQKIISSTQPPVWEGPWKNASHSYIAFQIVDVDKIYAGWIDISVDIENEKLIIHKAAISKEANKIVKAGI
jgi:hypothetical protein